MTWAEFRTRVFAYNRMERVKDYRFREVAYQIYVSNNFSKKQPISKHQYWSIGKEQKPKVSDSMRETILKAREKYNKDKNG